MYITRLNEMHLVQRLAAEARLSFHMLSNVLPVQFAPQTGASVDLLALLDGVALTRDRG